MLNKLELELKKVGLLEAIENTKQKKEKIILIIQSLVKELNSGRIARDEYEEKLKKTLNNRTAEQWIKYYDDYIKYYEYQAKLCDKLISKEKKKDKLKEKKEKPKKTRLTLILGILIAIVLISIVISLFNDLKPIFTGEEEISFISEAPEKPKIILEQAKEQANIVEETFNQLSAAIGKPVKWELEFDLDTPSAFSTTLPPESKLISIKNEQNQEIEVEANEEIIGKEINIKVKQKSKKFKIIYETRAPEIKEEVLGENKKLTITAPIEYSNIFSQTELSKELNKQELAKLRLYQIKNNQKKSIKFTAYDTNENNLFDSIEFIAPETGEYELVIEISKAEHLDENKIFISDIYDQVKAMDNIWSGEIRENEYVRVTFEIPLDNSRDMTIYPRIVSGNPIIEVYEINSTIKIAEFNNLTSNQYNKILLTNLQNIQATFDLRVINGSIEIDHIIDPVYTSTLWVDSFNPVSRKWTEVGTSPWLNSQDYPSNYIYTNKQNGLHSEFNFQDLPAGTTSINSVTLYLYINPGTEYIRAEVWDGSTWNIFPFTTNGWSWRSVPVIYLNTPEKVNNAKLRLSSKAFGGWSGQVMADAAYLSVNYNAPNQPPRITYIEPILSQIPIENSIKTITFEVRVSDPDGVDDINDNSVTAEFSKIGETTRTGNCLLLGDIPPNTASYSCSVDMQYYDGAGDWNIKISARDSVNNLAEDTSATFVYQNLNAILISQSSLTWPNIIQGAVNQIPGTSTIITNIGNREGQIVIQAKNLYGGERTAEYISANAFTAGAVTGAIEECNAPATATQLQDSMSVPIENSMLNNGPGAQEEIFYCIPQVPLVSSQTYSTSESWTITILFVAITIKKRKLKKKQTNKKISNKSRISNDNLIISLNLLSKEIKQNYSKEKQEIIILLTKEIKKKYKLNNKELIQLTKTKQESIPLSIFKYELGALESICRYMKENLGRSYHDISEILNRNERTIWVAYNKSKQKQPESIKITEEKILIPISIFNKKLTILESLILFLKSKQMKYIEIANLLNRDQRNIWTIYSRAIRK